MSILKTILRSICWNIGKILTYIIIALLLLLLFGKTDVFAKETGRIFYNGTQQGSTFTFNNIDDVAQWTKINANTIRYDNDNIVMTSGTEYTFSAQFIIVLEDDIDSVTSISTYPGYIRSGSIYNFSNASCKVTNNSKIISSNNLRKTSENTITINCSDFSFSAGNNTFLIRFFVNNSNNGYFNIIEMSRSNLVFKNSSNLSGSDKLIINQNKNAQDIINNQNTNTDKVINNQNQNADKIIDSNEKVENQLKENDKTNKGILDSITSFFGSFFKNLIDGIFGLIVPDNFDFLNGFLDTLEEKLGFIASVPIQFLEFMINLVNVDFDEITSITLPSFTIMGYDLWEEIEIDFTELIDVLKPYRIYTNIGCVCLCIGYLLKLYENFANGGGQ